MKQKSILCLLALLTATLISCKKEASPTPISHRTSGTNAQGYDAEVYSFKEIYLDGAGYSSSYNLAIFYGSTPTNPNVPSVYAGTVIINGVTLKIDNSAGSPGPNYLDTTYAITGTTYQINVSGSSQFPAGTLQYGQNYPVLADTVHIPSSVQISSGVSVLLNNCMHADSADVTFDDNSGHSFSKRYGVSNNQLNLSATPSQLSGFSPSSYGSISIDLVNLAFTAVGTKTYLVVLEKRYNKINVQFN